MSVRFKWIIILLVCCIPLYAQVRKAKFKIHDRGNLWETMKDDGTIGAPDPTNRIDTYPGMDWPGGPHVMSKDDQRMYSAGSGIWIGGYHSDGSLFFTENGPLGFVDNGTFEEITEQENFVGAASYDVNEAEEIITARWTTSENILCKRVSRAWSFPGLNNFIIIEYTFTNQSSSYIDDVYFGFPHLIRPSYQDFVVHNGWGDDFNRTDDYVDYDEERKLLFSYDDTPSPEFTQDIGNYWATTNEMRTTGYAGFSLLDADPAKGAAEQPANVFFTQLLNNTVHLTSTSADASSLYDILSGQDQSLQAEEGEHLTPFMLMACGPYRIEPGTSVNLVFVEAVNGLPLEEALKGIDVQSKLTTGIDSLKHTVDRARKLFENNYHINNVAPPSPELEIIAVPSKMAIKLVWPPLEDTWVNPITGRSNISEYHVYRSERSFIGPYELIQRRIRPGRQTDRDRYYDEDIQRWIYEDNSIALGVSYYYTVTAFDSAGNESWWTNRNEQAIRAANEPARNTLNVRVFPNPFREVSGFLTSGEENTIVWTNLPARCRIRIYTSSGELIRTLEHDNPSIGEEVWDQLTDARQRSAPGIYFWTVESDVGNAKGTLLIIK